MFRIEFQRVHMDGVQPEATCSKCTPGVPCPAQGRSAAQRRGPPPRAPLLAMAVSGIKSKPNDSCSLTILYL
ncbi:unnamed protein product [Arctogadus glacialis]